jgi:hypothetical protein
MTWSITAGAVTATGVTALDCGAAASAFKSLVGGDASGVAGDCWGSSVTVGGVVRVFRTGGDWAEYITAITEETGGGSGGTGGAGGTSGTVTVTGSVPLDISAISLTAGDGALLAAAIAGLWALGWVFRVLGRAIAIDEREEP